MLSELRERVNFAIDPVARAFARAGFTPNSLTCIGLIFSLIAGVLFGISQPRFAGLVLLMCGFFDIIDGAVARVSGRVTAFGGVLDSVVDRYTEAVIFIGIIFGGLPELGQYGWLWVVLALVGGFMVSYIRARAEAAGSGKLSVGIAERAERLLILGVGAMLNLTGYAVVLVVILTYFTAAHRLVVAYIRLR